MLNYIRVKSILDNVLQSEGFWDGGPCVLGCTRHLFFLLQKWLGSCLGVTNLTKCAIKHYSLHSFKDKSAILSFVPLVPAIGHIFLLLKLKSTLNKFQFQFQRKNFLIIPKGPPRGQRRRRLETKVDGGELTEPLEAFYNPHWHKKPQSVAWRENIKRKHHARGCEIRVKN